MMRRSRSQAWLLRQMMYRQSMFPLLLLLLVVVAGVVGAVEREVPQRGELRFDASAFDDLG